MAFPTSLSSVESSYHMACQNGKKCNLTLMQKEELRREQSTVKHFIFARLNFRESAAPGNSRALKFRESVLI